MLPAHPGYRSNPRFHYGVGFDLKSFSTHHFSVEELPANIDTLRFRRIKNSHRGIGKLRNLKWLLAYCVNQDCLDELAALSNLEVLYISELNATDLSPLKRCRALRNLIIKGATKVPNLDWLDGLPPLESLLLEHFKLVHDLSAVVTLRSIRAFGIEGSMWTKQKVESLSPVSELKQLEALFMANCKADNDGLKPLHKLSNLRCLQAPGFYPDNEFLDLRAALPNLECQWFREIDQYGSIKAALKARINEIKNPGQTET